MKALKSVVSLSLCTLFIGCSTNINTPEKDNNVSISVDKEENMEFSLKPTRLNWKDVSDKINELEKEGKVSSVKMTRSIPPQFSLSTTQEVYNSLKIMVEAKPEMENFSLNPTIKTSNEIIKRIEELKKSGEVESAIVAESYPPKVSLTTTQAIFDELNNIIENDKNESVKTIFVDSQLKTCSGGAGKFECMQIRESEDGDFKNFYRQIQGFEFESGHKYELEVKEEKVENPPADASSIKTILVKVVKKEKV